VTPDDAGKAATVQTAPRLPLQILCDDITATMRRNIAQGFGINEAANWLAELQPKLGRLVQDVQQQVPIMRIVDVGRRLLDEGHSLAQPRVILETLLRYAAQPDTERVIDAVRASLKRQIIHKATGGARDIPIIAISPDVEQRLREASVFATGTLGGEEAGPGRQIVDEVNRLISQAAADGDKPVITASAQGRDTVRNYLNRRGVRVPVVAIDDFDDGITTRVVGVVSARAIA
jgi:type III secretion protein V